MRNLLTALAMFGSLATATLPQAPSLTVMQQACYAQPAMSVCVR